MSNKLKSIDDQLNLNFAEIKTEKNPKPEIHLNPIKRRVVFHLPLILLLFGIVSLRFYLVGKFGQSDFVNVLLLLAIVIGCGIFYYYIKHGDFSYWDK